MHKTTPIKNVYNPNKFCRFCNANIAQRGIGKFNIFEGKNSVDDRERLSKLLQLTLCKDDVSSNICMKCHRQVEKIEKCLAVVNEDLPEFKDRYLNTVQSQRKLVTEDSRVKRCHRESPSAVYKSKRVATAAKCASRDVTQELHWKPRGIVQESENIYPPWMLRMDDAMQTKPATAVEVTIKYPSKTICKVLEDKDAHVVRQIVNVEHSYAVNAMLSCDKMKEAALEIFTKAIDKECKGLCSVKEPSILSATSPESLMNLTDKSVEEELGKRAPTLCRCLKAAAQARVPNSRTKHNDLSKKNEKFDRCVSAVSMATSILLRSRNPSVSAMAYKLSILLWHGGADKQFYTRGCKWGLCMSHRRTLMKIDECGTDFDTVVKQWKGHMEHSCKMESMLSTIHEESPLPAGFITTDVPELELSFPNLHEQADQSLENLSSSEKDSRNGIWTDHTHSLRERVQHKMEGKFDETVFSETLQLFDDSVGGEISGELVATLQNQLQLVHGAGYQITGDNLDFLIKVKHQSSSNQNKSVHWFNLNAVLHRVLGNELPNDQPIQSIIDVENIDFLPSAKDNSHLLQDLIPLVARLIVSKIPAFETFKHVAVWHIPHEYSATTKKKSEQVPLGLILKNENRNEEMIDILQEIHDKYVPTSKHKEYGEEMTTVLEKVFFGGDQLTDERARHSTSARSDGDNEYERLQGLLPKVEDWHAIRILYQILYDVYYKSNSASDVGTMNSNMNIINIVNAKTTNALDNFNCCKDYVNFETDAFIVAATLQYFGMESLATPPDCVIPPDILKGSKPEKRVWLHKHTKALLEQFVMKKQQSQCEEILAEVTAANQPQRPLRVNCRVCGKQYMYVKARDNHETREHASVIAQESTCTQKPSTPTEYVKKVKPNDDRYNYACSRLNMGLFIQNFDDAVKEGDGKRIIRCWKFALLIYKALGHTKYALAALTLQAAIKATLTPRQAHCLVWNRTVNNKGVAGRNISLDLRLEHLNNLLKGLLKHLGPNVTSEKSAMRCSKSIGYIEQFLYRIDSDLKITQPSGHHTVQRSEKDFKAIVSELHEHGKVFQCNPIPERQYQSFPNFSQDIIRKLNYKKLNDWITHHKKQIHKSE